MAAKKSKSRFTDLVKFVPEDYDDKSIQTRSISYDEYEDEEDEEMSGINPDDLPDIATISTFEEAEELENDDDPDDFDSKGFASDINIDDAEENDFDFEEEDLKVMDEPVKRVQHSRNEKAEQTPVKGVNETVILGNTTIKGDIITDTGIQIYGAVLGNIESGGKVQLVGKVEGDITGKSVYITNTNQVGNITAETDVFIKEGCIVEGNVEGQKIHLKGKVIGNINATNMIEFESGSEIEGDVSAKTFNIRPGAKINGSIRTI